MRFVLLFVMSRVSNPLIELSIMESSKKSVVRIVLEIVKLVATALLGYFGGNAVI